MRDTEQNNIEERAVSTWSGPLQLFQPSSTHTTTCQGAFRFVAPTQVNKKVDVHCMLHMDCEGSSQGEQRPENYKLTS